jgi:hypothetical protein
MASSTQLNKGPWTHRVLVLFFTLLFGVLFYWLLGFLMRDIDTWEGPDYREVEKQSLEAGLLDEAASLKTRMEDTSRSLTEQKSRQSVLRDSTENAQRTLSQLQDMQRLALQKGMALSEAERQALEESLRLFLANQRQYQEINDRIAGLNEQSRQWQEQERLLNQRMESGRRRAQETYGKLQWQHQLKLAAVKLAVLLPLLLAAVFVFLKKRGGLYTPLVYAFGLAVLAKVILVIHQHFPTRYFKYLLLAASLAVVARVLVYLLRMVAHPKADWLLKQYREAYERFLCPVCSFPIRRGPMRYFFWTRRTVKKLPILPEAGLTADEPYTCPSCGTRLFEECAACHAVRHALLPACTRCGAGKEITPG